ncbi:hypothetical protein [Flavobacterium sp. 5]|uniref:hypothetical protein n=1 Tax=Flavobacterium sp. 5 TaxID=2035199 RepID=UPI000C2BD70E|nr:hypothetical protein [Flavobacterium sp. 5]
MGGGRSFQGGGSIHQADGSFQQGHGSIHQADGSSYQGIILSSEALFYWAEYKKPLMAFAPQIIIDKFTIL